MQRVVAQNSARRPGSHRLAYWSIHKPGEVEESLNLKLKVPSSLNIMRFCLVY